MAHSAAGTTVVKEGNQGPTTANDKATSPYANPKQFPDMIEMLVSQKIKTSKTSTRQLKKKCQFFKYVCIYILCESQMSKYGIAYKIHLINNAA